MIAAAIMRLALGFGLFLSAVAVNAQTTVKYVHTDSLGSVVAMTDATGALTQASREYEPYGQQLTPAVQDGPGYTGHVQDAATGLVYMQQRYYDPDIGRFLSVDQVTALSDPVGYFGRYHYANNNPYTFTDPDGRAWGLAAKVVKVIVKGGDVASTVAGAVEDTKVLFSRDATVGQRLVAAGSLATEVASPVSARDVKAGIAAVKGADAASDAKRASTLTPGPHAGESIPVNGPGRANAAQQSEINRIGQDTGCHTCGATSPGTTSGNHVMDHQPASSLNPPGGEQRGYPHCINCSRRQGGEVNAERRRRENE